MYLRWDALAVIHDLNPQSIVQSQMNNATARLRMPCGVAKALDGDAIRRDLDRRRQTGQGVWRIYLHQQRAELIVLRRLFAERRDQPKLIQRRRAQVVYEPPDLANGKLR